MFEVYEAYYIIYISIYHRIRIVYVCFYLFLQAIFAFVYIQKDYLATMCHYRRYFPIAQIKCTFNYVVFHLFYFSVFETFFYHIFDFLFGNRGIFSFV